ncbi:hypothetical protein GQ600_2008 [Phytophthora cactorum]|nr:hypothetical protein GQ600_2008 [Phytophthora cactorum]
MKIGATTKKTAVPHRHRDTPRQIVNCAIAADEHGDCGQVVARGQHEDDTGHEEPRELERVAPH